MASFDPTAPFVLLDDARTDGAGARLYAQPVEIVVAHAPDAVDAALERVRAAATRGLHAAGFVAFEAGHVLEPKLRPAFRQPDQSPLLWFGLFKTAQPLAFAELQALTSGRAAVMAWKPRVSAAAHEAAVLRIKDLITAGDIYQVNLTFPCDVAVIGHPLALYGRLRAAQLAPHAAVVNCGGSWILSFSPELFFTLDNGVLTAKPMKGTAARADDPGDDRATAAALFRDPKNRAENLMIVDLLRNDLSRVAAAGSVAVPKLFEIESYPTVHQMTSTITAKLAPGRDPVDVLRTLFPCGSVTGAPKIRALEVIAEVEPYPRGVYTGSIGHISPDGNAAFNVAIRTLVIDAAGRATLGLGSGIVADSDPAAEWAECCAKGAFLDHARRPFDLIETMRLDPAAGLIRGEHHLERLQRSALALGFRFDKAELRDLLATATAEVAKACRVRLLLARSGSAVVQLSPLPPAPSEPVAVVLAPLPVAPSDPRLAHKTTDRGFYDAARAAGGAYEVLFIAPDGALTEGSFTNLFVECGGRLLTPPLAAGLLPGVLRAELIATGQAVEARLTPADLPETFLIGNSLRGLLRARLA